MYGADSSKGHLDLAGKSILLINFFLNLLIPAQAIIAALSPQNSKSGNKGLKFISFHWINSISKTNVSAQNCIHGPQQTNSAYRICKVEL